ncbi:MAG TPA: DnaD domain protein [Candidatus Bathyarchaeia archaeon]|nr:DnaD domain protein [Candidatus Bathyarchaeia archaeon]
MRLLWNEITPKDRYVVRLIRPISFSEFGFVTHFYLPIIGVESHTLYQLLLHEVEEKSGACTENTHRGLMLMTALPLDRLLTARERLEAMGLLDVYRRENNQGDSLYEYVVKPPLTPAEFFNDYVLSLMLLNRIENFRFEQLRERYADTHWAQVEREFADAENVTKDFHEVFDSLKASELEVPVGSEREQFLTKMEEERPPAPMLASYQAKPSHEISLASFRINLPTNTRSEKVLTGENIEFFYKLIHFYQIDSWSLGRELSDWTMYKSDGSLDREVLRKRLIQKYVEGLLNREVAAASAGEELAPGKLPEVGSEMFRRVCRGMSPLVLLEQVVGGKLSKPFVDRAESLIFADSMSAEVVNALLLHTLHTQQMELPKSYLETIRDTWKAKQITTVEEAIKQILERAEARNQIVEKASKTKKTGESAYPRKNGRNVMQDKLPESVQRQLEREKEKPAADTGEAKKQTVMDDPELKALLESMRNGQKGGKS